MAISLRKKNMNLLKHVRRISRWALIVEECILFLSLHLLHAWCGEVHLEEYYKTMKEVDTNMHFPGIITEMDGQVEVKPHQKPFVGGGIRVYRENSSKHWLMEVKFESLSTEWITKLDVKLTNTFSNGWERIRAKTNKLLLGTE